MRVITIANGKGGVGNSTVSLNLAVPQARAERRHRVGLLDADLYSPDIPLMLGLTRQQRLGVLGPMAFSGPVRLEPVERFGIRGPA
jgi:ATP-binding protein involved in chromosome partitioning